MIIPYSRVSAIILDIESSPLSMARNQGYSFELRRKLFHSICLLLPIIYKYTEQSSFILYLSVVCILIIIIDFSRSYIAPLNRFIISIVRAFSKNVEISGHSLSGVSHLFLGILITAFLFEKDICITSWTILGISDAISGLINRLLPIFFPQVLYWYQKHLPNYEYYMPKYKNPLSGMGFFASSLIIAYIMLGSCLSMWILLVTCWITALVEFYSCHFKIDDNLSIPLTFCIAVYLLQKLEGLIL